MHKRSGLFRSASALFPQLDDLGRDTPPLFGLGGVMFFGRVYVLVPENIRDEVDVACFLIEHGAVRAAQLVWGNIFERHNRLAVLFDKILHRAGGDSSALK